MELGGQRQTDKRKGYVSVRNECVTAIKNTATIKEQSDKHVYSRKFPLLLRSDQTVK